MIRDELKEIILQSLHSIGISHDTFELAHPANADHGDFACNVAMVLFSQQITIHLHADNPRALATLVADAITEYAQVNNLIYKIDVAGPGFINFFITQERLLRELDEIEAMREKYGSTPVQSGKKIMVEYAHPNTHKEMHIGHMRTLITGESLARILDFTGARVFRANYQGDIGPHVAKSIWGTKKLLEERKSTLAVEDKNLTHMEKARLLGDGYVLANQQIDTYKHEMDELNKKIYQSDPEIMEIYQKTRQWSLDYYDEFYGRFGTSFDKLYFESMVASDGMQIVKEHLGSIFIASEGAIIFPGETLGLHNRVFVTAHETPTYEAKELALAHLQSQDFHFDQCIHVVGNEQKGYFEVVIAAIEAVFPNLQGKEYHLPMGMFNLIGEKISSRTGNIIRVDSLINQVKELLQELVTNEALGEEAKAQMLEVAAIGAIKCSTLKAASTATIVFDPKQSVSLHGDSGPYLQYTYARCRSVLEKAGQTEPALSELNQELTTEEHALLAIQYQFPEVVQIASLEYAPHHICNYLFVLAARFNTFYAHCPIVAAENQTIKDRRVALTRATSIILKQGLYLLGIDTVERM